MRSLAPVGKFVSWLVVLVCGATPALAQSTNTNCPAVNPGVTVNANGSKDTLYNATWQVAGKTNRRYYIVHTPPGYDPTNPLRYPLVFFLHPGSSCAINARNKPVNLADYADELALAEQPTFFAVYPQGYFDPVTKLGYWNAGNCSGADGVTQSCATPAYTNGSNDIDYFNSVLQQVQSKFRTDTARVYVLGHSDGGSMAHLLGCQPQTHIAAVGSIEGTFKVPTCSLGNPPVSVIAFHSLGDTQNPYYGTGTEAALNVVPNTGREGDTSVEPFTMNLWRAANSCTDAPLKSDPAPSTTGIGTYTLTSNTFCHFDSTGTSSQVLLYSLCDPYYDSDNNPRCDASHNWLYSLSTLDLDWRPLVWNFFQSRKKL
ncbi:alpha/beta hydrolase family esterase [Gloeobacter kilaueensis]|nr:PHB depolymerase family esterase [Gloeobacter kilaueensis]